ncbi:alpha-ketoglutarate-dependent dioxygenase AlkB [Sphingomonas pruni]|uniref:alpha-ketoglutarate-dependent dioxygenase AlkB n=1 Tax=Sphingomonas pruni TaxID=40683 RepID=UPI00082E8283|nr:alpha-ketoglutarate-dependent dioxygenase AlkB [Sphingomonas pruni]
MTADLFDTPAVPGLGAQSDVLTRSEERALIAAIDSVDMAPFRFQQWTGKRLTHSFGWQYDFQSGELGRGAPMPDWLLPIRDRAADAAGLASDVLVQALLLRYDAGAGIGWHRDRPIYDQVVGISLGAPATMRFRRKAGERWRRVNVLLEPRCLYHLAGEVRHDWEHSIAPMDETRWSITFRSFSAQGLRIATAA